MLRYISLLHGIHLERKMYVSFFERQLRTLPSGDDVDVWDLGESSDHEPVSCPLCIYCFRLSTSRSKCKVIYCCNDEIPVCLDSLDYKPKCEYVQRHRDEELEEYYHPAGSPEGFSGVSCCIVEG